MRGEPSALSCAYVREKMNFEYNLPLIDKDREITYFQVYRTDKI